MALVMINLLLEHWNPEGLCSPSDMQFCNYHDTTSQSQVVPGLSRSDLNDESGPRHYLFDLKNKKHKYLLVLWKDRNAMSF